MIKNTFLGLMMALALLGCTHTSEYQTCNGAAWGTTYHITYKAERDLCDSIVAVMHRVDMSLSPFAKGSLISAINAGERVEADSMLRCVMELSKRVHALSGGMFDPTVAPLVNLWGFGFVPGAADRPTAEQIEAALLSVGIDSCGIDSCGFVYRKSPDTQFNFSAVAKGYGVDCIAQMLRRNGCSDYMVEVGGEVALSGLSPSGRHWRIQVDAPVAEVGGQVQHSPLRVMQLTDVGIATSGNYRNRRNTSAGEVAHTISPVTGMPVVTNTLSVTVLAETTALADALATALMAMPDSAGLAFAESLDGVRTMMVRQGHDDSYQLIYTGGFEDLLLE